MKLALLAGLAIAAVAAAPPARAVPRLGPAIATSAEPSFLVQIRHHRHHRHHWRHWSWRGDPTDDAAPETAGTSVAPQPPATPADSGKPTIRWIDPDRSGR